MFRPQLQLSHVHRNNLFPYSRTFTASPRCNSSGGSSSIKDGLAAFRAFGRPFAKVFLGAILTYQILYWTWFKLETDESKLEKNGQIAALEDKAREMISTRK
ncbi:hypothetical protein DTO166G4_6232 [Paecilomyces variotii]|nr:hypothetical protein DTO166G4_6232 [Paecilomyces variotii]KAJ9225310.1 hypothetical protein DTO169C6_2340 [Paecilomyces variotii]KAJ9233648.1 hypothetical protein DTO166G5_5582 [Paecilomyces variotii]KAJ9242540.1 hypothetical protein DTO169E5_3103 [Paecilomyces variotii]KAJ9249716.1 hypothetical protein DTO207G8_6503 [Paecilomyces variotii]